MILSLLLDPAEHPEYICAVIFESDADGVACVLEITEGPLSAIRDYVATYPREISHVRLHGKNVAPGFCTPFEAAEAIYITKCLEVELEMQSCPYETWDMTK